VRGVIGMAGAFDAMVSGAVDLNGAKKAGAAGAKPMAAE
jgi:hypothetical protein